MQQGQDAVVGHRLLQNGCAELFPSRSPGMQEHGPHFGLHGQAMGADVNLSDASQKKKKKRCLPCPSVGMPLPGQGNLAVVGRPPLRPSTGLK
jgi:hypothetical protein